MNNKPKLTDFDKYRYDLPYASQMFGVYQPLLGLRSRFTKQRVNRASFAAVKQVIKALASSSEVKQVHASSPGALGPDTPVPSKAPNWLASGAVAHVQQAVTQFRQQAGRKPTTGELKDIVQKTGTQTAGVHPLAHAVQAGAFGSHGAAPAGLDINEAVVTGTMQYLAKHAPDVLHAAIDGSKLTSRLKRLKAQVDPLAQFDPDTQAALLSPIGLIQLYRQYFFEFDSFLGPPVGHVWVSPGGSVEVYEVHTRKLTESREAEQSGETVSKSETTTQQQDDLSTSMARDNSENMSLGVTAQAGVNFGVFNASASTTFKTDSAQKASEQTAHKETRSQSAKVASEMRRSFKTIFKTSLEQTDTQSRRYVLSNTTGKLLNIELRRKMRKVGVQVQHVGTQLCWQVFVDRPGDGLGIADLVHLAQPADLSALQPPEAPPVLQSQEETQKVTFEFEGLNGNTDRGADYTHVPDLPGLPPGMAVADFGPLGALAIKATQTVKVAPPAPGYTLADVRVDHVTPSDPSSSDAYANAEFKLEKETFEMTLKQVNFDDAKELVFTLKLLWEPPERTAEQDKAYKDALAKFEWQQQQLVHAAYINAVRERVKLAGQVAKRPEDDLRAEERTVVYRRLLSQLIQPAEDYDSNPQVAHVTSELIRALFDVDNMLYFVAPDWWKPRGRASKSRSMRARSQATPIQHAAGALGGAHIGGAGGMNVQTVQPQMGLQHKSAAPSAAAPKGGAAPHSDDAVVPEAIPQHLTKDDLVGWGGTDARRRNNYLVTEESAPAPLGASLGWTLQLDGDDRRNAFLNAPWVKAVIPIRPGMEEAALNWLTKAHVEGTDGLDAKYIGDEPGLQGKTIGEALRILAQDLKRINTDPQSVLKTEVVYEQGFDPLDKGVRPPNGTPFEMVDQWVEVLPTEQVVAVEYTPPEM
jgi:hypothetical protein